MALRTLSSLKSFLRSRALGVGLPERLVGYAIIWWILTEGDVRSFAFGIPAMVAAALINPFAPSGPRAWRLARGGPFLAMFAWLSLRSAIDVAGRAIRPARPLEPGIVEHAWRLETSSARHFMANLINLMPGSLTIDPGGRVLVIHVLGAKQRTLAGVRLIEERVAGLFGEVIQDDA